MAAIGRTAAGKGGAEAMLMMVMVVIITIHGAVCVTVFEVGNVAGWNLPSVAHVNYTLWADSHTFIVGDVLHFRYNRSNHNVALVSRVDYESCDATNPITTFNDGDTNLTLNRSGTFYLLCSVPSHCELGEKLMVHVRRHPLPSARGISPASSTTVSPPPTQLPTNLPSPDTSHAPLFQSTKLMLFASLLVIVVSFMQH